MSQWRIWTQEDFQCHREQSEKLSDKNKIEYQAPATIKNCRAVSYRNERHLQFMEVKSWLLSLPYAIYVGEHLTCLASPSLHWRFLVKATALEAQNLSQICFVLIPILSDNALQCSANQVSLPNDTCFFMPSCQHLSFCCLCILTLTAWGLHLHTMSHAVTDCPGHSSPHLVVWSKELRGRCGREEVLLSSFHVGQVVKVVLQAPEGINVF